MTKTAAVSAQRHQGFHTRFGALLMLALMCGCGQKTSTAPGLSASQSAAIRDSVTTFVEAWRKAVIALDTTQIANFYATDSTFRWVEDGRIRYASAKELLDAWRGTVPGVKAMDLILDQTEVHPLAPGVAAVTTSFTQKVTDSAGRQGGFAGATSLVAIHTPNGWRFLLGHTSAAGGTTPPAARGSGG